MNFKKLNTKEKFKKTLFSKFIGIVEKINENYYELDFNYNKSFQITSFFSYDKNKKVFYRKKNSVHFNTFKKLCKAPFKIELDNKKEIGITYIIIDAKYIDWNELSKNKYRRRF